MTTITALVVADSIAADTRIRITTLELRYPRFIHSEFMTHRVFSRNASSSRAIPTHRLISAVTNDMAEPVHWGKNQPGMQAREEMTGWRLSAARLLWRVSGRVMCFAAGGMAALGAHKQIVNRMIEPWSHITVCVTSTEWENFMALRDHEDADPTIRALAVAIKDAMEDTPYIKVLKPGQWHLPYLTLVEQQPGMEAGGEAKEEAKRISAARCARTSYLTHDGQRPTAKDDMALYRRLAAGRPQHLSPFEHQATPSGDLEFHRNFAGWVQFREEVEHDDA